MQLIDDQIPTTLLGGEVFTTGYWYVRLCQAVLGASDRTGVLATPFARLVPPQNRLAVERLLELPANIGLQADVFLSAPSPRLAAALQNEGIRVTDLSIS